MNLTEKLVLAFLIIHSCEFWFSVYRQEKLRRYNISRQNVEDQLFEIAAKKSKEEALRRMEILVAAAKKYLELPK